MLVSWHIYLNWHCRSVASGPENETVDKYAGGFENNMSRRRKTECLGEEVIIGLGYFR